MIIDLWLINLSFIFFLDHHHDHVHICFMHALHLATTILFALHTCFAYSWFGCFIDLMMNASFSMIMLLKGIFPFVILCERGV